MIQMIFDFINTYSDAITTIATVIALLLSLVALLQSHKQIKISNQQALFERRISNYMIFKEIYHNCESAVDLMRKQNRNKCELATDFVAHCFGMKSAYLADACLAFENPLNKNDDKPKMHKTFLSIIQNMKDKSLEASIIFDDIRISKFYELYANFLMASYQYAIELQNVKNYNKEVLGAEFHPKTLDEICKELDEPKIRNEWFESFDNFDVIYKDLKNKPFKESVLKVR